jgi:uncharacterized protein (TIGR00251 family)
MALDLREVLNATLLTVRVHPGAKRNAITGEHDGALKISLTTPPTDGRANVALINFLAKTLNIPRTQINLLTGATSRSKTLRLEGVTPAQAAALLA